MASQNEFRRLEQEVRNLRMRHESLIRFVAHLNRKFRHHLEKCEAEGCSSLQYFGEKATSLGEGAMASADPHSTTRITRSMSFGEDVSVATTPRHQDSDLEVTPSTSRSTNRGIAKIQSKSPKVPKKRKRKCRRVTFTEAQYRRLLREQNF